MEKALTKVGSLKVGNLWISKKAKEEFSNISEDISVWTFVYCSVCFFFLASFVPFALPFLCYHCDVVCPCLISGFGGNYGHYVCNVA
jgi:hypothetical protein